MIDLYKRGRIWWARGSARGITITRTSLDTQFKEVAWQRAMELELRGGQPSVKWAAFSQQFEGWKFPHLKEGSRTKYKFVLARFSRYLAERRILSLAELTPDLITAYTSSRSQDIHPRSGNVIGLAGIKSDLRILHSVFDYAVECGYIAKIPIISTGLNTAGGKTVPFSRDEVARLLAHPYVRGRAERLALVLTFLYTGLRISDVSLLHKSAINWRSDTILLRTTKRDKDVFLGLHGDLRDALTAHLARLNPAQRSSLYLFPTRTGRRSWAQSMDAQLRRMFRKAGIGKGHAHRFRDTFAVGLLAEGASLYDVAKLMGITMRVAELHYAPYSAELRDRARGLVKRLNFGNAKAQLEHTGS